MTRKDYIVIADALIKYGKESGNMSELQHVINRLSEALYEDNKLFNSVRFDKYIHDGVYNGQTRLCSTCKTTYDEAIDIEFIDNNGECFSCDHNRGEVIAESINVGDTDNPDEVAITPETTENKGVTIQ